MKQRQVGTILGIIFVIIGLGLGTARSADPVEGLINEPQNHFTFEVKFEGTDLVIFLNDEQTTGRIPGVKDFDDATQASIIDRLTEQLVFCATKGNWAHDMAVRAGEDPRTMTAASEIKQMYYEYEGSLIRRASLVDYERVIRTAYKHGYKDPYEFAKKNVKWCMYEGF